MLLSQAIQDAELLIGSGTLKIHALDTYDFFISFKYHEVTSGSLTPALGTE